MSGGVEGRGRKVDGWVDGEEERSQAEGLESLVTGFGEVEERIDGAVSKAKGGKMREEVEEGREGVFSTRTTRRVVIGRRESQQKTTKGASNLTEHRDDVFEESKTFRGVEVGEVREGEGLKVRREDGESLLLVADKRSELEAHGIPLERPPFPFVVHKGQVGQRRRKSDGFRSVPSHSANELLQPSPLHRVLSVRGIRVPPLPTLRESRTSPEEPASPRYQEIRSDREW